MSLHAGMELLETEMSSTNRAKTMTLIAVSEDNVLRRLILTCYRAGAL